VGIGDGIGVRRACAAWWVLRAGAVARARVTTAVFFALVGTALWFLPVVFRARLDAGLEVERLEALRVVRRTLVVFLLFNVRPPQCGIGPGASGTLLFLRLLSVQCDARHDRGTSVAKGCGREPEFSSRSRNRHRPIPRLDIQNIPLI